ncbi:ABC transporter permease [Lentibacter sp. XHP0401]|jgi:polar amino acid transport system permease protein|uniref:ABC transporter permease n=1 Tax=Lentibacter sp. XHP0401 TaxID=2984334 RepID=UPI0021E88271|nr:ABC transporter permease subunit [Lentibacter sp. XHP0401]MCV2892006.1 ABC transporter permease subunit [Lentibacter sp. XHP0401]
MDHFRLLSFGDHGWGDELLIGLGVTLALAICTLPFAIILSFLVHWAKVSRYRILRSFGMLYTTVFKSLPEILTLLILYYQAQAIIGWLIQSVIPGAHFSISPFVAGMISLSLVISAYGSEVVRAALGAVGNGQFEAAQSLGLSPRIAFIKVILPQLWRHALPGFGNLWIILLKDTSLVSVIALSELTHVAGLAITTTRQPFVFYGLIAVIYVLLVTLSATAQKRLERRVNLGFTRTET